MLDNEEKFKALFKNEEGVKKFADDGDFVKKVCQNKVSYEDYMKQFKKFGVEFSADEVKEIKKSVEKILKMQPEKISEKLLKNVSGGHTVPWGNDTTGKLATAVTVVGVNAPAVTTVSTGGACAACLAVAIKAAKSGKKGMAAAFGIAGVALGGTAAVSVPVTLATLPYVATLDGGLLINAHDMIEDKFDELRHKKSR